MTSDLKIIETVLHQAESLSQDPDLLEVISQIPLKTSYKINLENYKVSSHTLMGEAGSEFENLKTASDFLSKMMTSSISSEILKHTNQLVLGKTQSTLRKVEILEPYPFPKVENISAGLLLLEDFFNRSNLNSVVKRIAFTQGMLSLHPFADGNHRTCRLFLDHSLLQLGIPSLTVQKTSELLMANPTDHEVFSLASAIQKVLYGIGETLIASNS